MNHLKFAPFYDRTQPWHIRMSRVAWNAWTFGDSSIACAAYWWSVYLRTINDDGEGNI